MYRKDLAPDMALQRAGTSRYCFKAGARWSRRCIHRSFRTRHAARFGAGGRLALGRARRSAAARHLRVERAAW